MGSNREKFNIEKAEILKSVIFAMEGNCSSDELLFMFFIDLIVTSFIIYILSFEAEVLSFKDERNTQFRKDLLVHKI